MQQSLEILVIDCSLYILIALFCYVLLLIRKDNTSTYVAFDLVDLLFA